MTDYKPNVTKSIDNLNELEEKINNLQEKSVTYTEGGEYTIEPDEEYFALKKVNVDVDIAPAIENIEVDFSLLESVSSGQNNIYNAITKINRINLGNTTYCVSMFNGMKGLTEIGEIIMDNAQNCGAMFINCPSLAKIPVMNLPKCTNLSNFVSGTTTNLTDESLENILKSLLTLTSEYTGSKSLTTLTPIDTYVTKWRNMPEWTQLQALGWSVS